jgi:hypothetical protein
MMAGPGAIATTLLLTRDAGYGARLAIIIAIVLAVCLLCMLCFVSASLIARTLGRTGNAVLSRVLGILLAAYSVQFVINGIVAVRVSLPPRLGQSVSPLILRDIYWYPGRLGETAHDPAAFSCTAALL